MTSPNSRGTFPFSGVDYLVSKRGPLGNSPHAPSIHILDENSLLNIFYLYRPAIFDVDEDDDDRILGGKGWERERWWYKLAQVCQRWRILILGSASYLGLCLVCVGMGTVPRSVLNERTELQRYKCTCGNGNRSPLYYV